MSGKSHVFDRFAVLFSVVIVWIYAHLLTVSGAYKNKSDITQVSCRTDRAGIIGAAPWYAYMLFSFFVFYIIVIFYNSTYIFVFIGYGFLIHFNGELQHLMLEKLLL